MPYHGSKCELSFWIGCSNDGRSKVVYVPKDLSFVRLVCHISCFLKWLMGDFPHLLGRHLCGRE